MAMQKRRFFIASILNPQSDSWCEYYPQGLLVVEGNAGRSIIKAILPLIQGLKKYQSQMDEQNTFDLTHHLIMPGFYDMHFHWVQDDVREMPKDSLLQWLEQYTFPAEMKFADKTYAKRKAQEFFKKLSMTGTLGGACYSSIHEVALDAAMSEVRGDFVIGNVLMNMNSPQELVQAETDSIELIKRSIKKFGRRYCLTPRFAITTTPAVMQEGTRLADKAKCFKQTHLSETPGEIDFVLALYRKLPGFEKVKNYTEIYQKTGMLGKRSLMGHGIHLSGQELKLLSKTATSLIHCPTSNAPIRDKGLGSGLFDFKKVEKAKVRWALGSDIGGGPFLSMFDVMRSFVRQNQKQGITGATFTKAIYRSTLAGAKILGNGKRNGNLDKGKEANFVVVPFRPKKQVPSNAEMVLQALLSSSRLKREELDSLIQMVVYRGEVLFRRK